MTKLRALYYPFSRCLDENHLKRVLLVFDEIWFIDALSQHAQLQYGNVDLWFSRDPLALVNASASGPLYFRRDLSFDFAQQKWEKLHETYRYLLSEKVINVYNPVEMVQKYDQVLASCWLYDILFLNRRYFHGSIDYAGFGGGIGGGETSVASWQTLQSRIPPSFFSSLEPVDRLKLYVPYRDNIRRAAFSATDNLPYIDYRLSKDSPRGKNLFAEITKLYESDIKRQVESVWEPYSQGEEGQEYGAIFRQLDIEGYPVIRMPFDFGASLCINQALLIADLEDFSLVTEHDVCHSLLLAKYQLAANNQQKEQLANVLISDDSEHLSKFASLAINIVNSLIPNALLESRGFEDIIKYRRQSHEHRQRFLNNVKSLSAELEAHIWDAEFSEEIQKMLKHIEVEAEAYTDSLKEIYEELFGGSSLLEKAGTALSPSLMGTILQLSPGQILLLACGGLGTALAITLPDLAQAWQKKRKARRNYLTYLIDFRRDFKL